MNSGSLAPESESYLLHYMKQSYFNVWLERFSGKGDGSRKRIHVLKERKSRISKILDMAKIVIYVPKSSKCMGLNYPISYIFSDMEININFEKWVQFSSVQLLSRV